MSLTAIVARVQTLLETLDIFKDTQTASTISFTLAGSKISDSASGLGWLDAGDKITVTGSVNNNSTFTVVTPGAAFVTVAEAIITEPAAGAVTITGPNHVTLGNWRVLETGVVDAAIIHPGQFGANESMSYQVWREYDVLIDYMRKYRDDTTTHNEFITGIDAIIGLFNAYPRLNDLAGVEETTFSADGDPVHLKDTTNAGPFFVMQPMRLTVNYKADQTTGEYT